jgi:H+/Cl- antiporter ClcA
MFFVTRRGVLQRRRRIALEAFDRQRRGLAPVVVLAGVVGGAVGAAYLGMLHLIQRGLFPKHWSDGEHLVVMVVVGVVIAVLARYLGRPSNVELLVDNIHVAGGTDELRSLRSLIPISLLCVGSGGPLGPEAPLVTTTGSIASWLGRRAELSRDERRVVSITGMAAGFTVLFAAPLGSALFALEILHRRGLEYYEALLPAAIGSLCGYAVSTLVTGTGLEPMWEIPAPLELRPADLGYGVLAGVAGALIAVVFTYLVLGMRRLAAPVPVRMRPVAGAVVLSLMAFASPYALTNGEIQINDLTPAKLVVGTLLLGAALKLVASAVAMATGWIGGFIIPLFFIGFALGHATEGHLPGGSSWALAAALMVACNVGVTKTPIGSVLVVTEMGGMVLLPTTLIAALVSLVLSSQVALIESQQRRFDTSALEEDNLEDAERDRSPGVDGHGRVHAGGAATP